MYKRHERIKSVENTYGYLCKYVIIYKNNNFYNLFL